ncbi:hypothetical protein CMUC_0730 [Campylobacter mucosalis CCUG 21559]|uniref:Uncharacterized protein n=1 Tax=Campylobacter mucosalis CCUG 21559 TaxID=1032067 RepID=A0A6G5QG27_9BACT|nr:hypothetical protein [Campylobacter mucosalis]QCD44527.1 hypothetical protein CMUC_0730 [Campylobacter mucosalis CCUG 21559]
MINAYFDKGGIDSNGEESFRFEYGGIEKVGACKKYGVADWLVCSANELSDYNDTLNTVKEQAEGINMINQSVANRTNEVTAQVDNMAKDIVSEVRKKKF